MPPSTESNPSELTALCSVVALPPTVSPSRKRNRDRKTTKLDAPPPRRLRMRIDHSDRVWAGRCGCKSPHCMADEFEFSSDTGVSDDSEESEDEDEDQAEREDADTPENIPSKRSPQDPSDLVPMMLHLMLMM